MSTSKPDPLKPEKAQRKSQLGYLLGTAGSYAEARGFSAATTKLTSTVVSSAKITPAREAEVALP